MDKEGIETTMSNELEWELKGSTGYPAGRNDLPPSSGAGF